MWPNSEQQHVDNVDILHQAHGDRKRHVRMFCCSLTQYYGDIGLKFAIDILFLVYNDMIIN